MKKLLLVVALLAALTPAAAVAASSQMNTGCGLGTLIFQGKADDSLLLQLLAVTTNGTFGNQTFGMTTGTLECRQPSKIVKSDRLNEFVRANMDGLAKDIAAGRGETLGTLAELMEVPQADREGLNRTLKANFARIYPNDRVEFAHVVDTIVTLASRG